MKIREIMTQDVRSCTPDTNLGQAALMMWDGDCGTVPVVGSDGRISGMITDRDISMCVATQNRLPSDIRVREAMSRNLYSCGEDQDVKTALETMKRNQVRRLPVVDSKGTLKGIVSINDLVLQARSKTAELSYEHVMETLKAICAPRPQVELVSGRQAAEART